MRCKKKSMKRFIIRSGLQNKNGTVKFVIGLKLENKSYDWYSESFMNYEVVFRIKNKRVQDCLLNQVNLSLKHYWDHSQYWCFILNIPHRSIVHIRKVYDPEIHTDIHWAIACANKLEAIKADEFLEKAH